MNILKKQGVAILIALVMIAAAIGIGWAKAHSPATPYPDSYGESLVYDEANVLSSSTERKLDQRNRDLLEDMDVAIAVVTVNYNSDNLGRDAITYAENIGLGGYDFIVMLDISGDNYWLVQGANLVDWFSDQECSDYAYEYMEKYFARGDYDKAVLSLTEALEEWYYDNY